MAPKRSGASVRPKPRDKINPEMAAVRGDPLSTTKNKKNTPDRLEIKKFNPILKKMTVHKEIK